MQNEVSDPASFKKCDPGQIQKEMLNDKGFISHNIKNDQILFKVEQDLEYVSQFSGQNH